MDEVVALVRRTLAATTGDGDDVAVLTAGAGFVQWLGYPDAVQIEITHPALAQRKSWWRRSSSPNPLREKKIATLTDLGFTQGPVNYGREISTTELDWDQIAAVIASVLDRVLDVRDADSISVETF
ncbi:hypothetical protein [Nocardia nova]|uniref:hypothetical protein n=1 Tax=Nocardia nova TaxID=37330 RepID=UPI0033C320B4